MTTEKPDKSSLTNGKNSPLSRGLILMALLILIITGLLAISITTGWGEKLTIKVVFLISILLNLIILKLFKGLLKKSK